MKIEHFSNINTDTNKIKKSSKENFIKKDTASVSNKINSDVVQISRQTKADKNVEVLFYNNIRSNVDFAAGSEFSSIKSNILRDLSESTDLSKLNTLKDQIINNSYHIPAESIVDSFFAKG